MVECDWAIVCDYAFNDSAGKTCLIGIFDRIYAKAVPTIHQRAVFATRLSGSPGEAFTVRVDIVRPTGSQLAKLEGNGALNENGSAGLLVQLQNLALPDYGAYPVSVYVNDELAARTGFIVERPKSGDAPS